MKSPGFLDFQKVFRYHIENKREGFHRPHPNTCPAAGVFDRLCHCASPNRRSHGAGQSTDGAATLILHNFGACSIMIFCALETNISGGF